jgi:hypothetical protein
MFFLRVRDPATGELNGIEVMKMKNKLGTRQLPTAELLLDGSAAKLISGEGRGIASISNMLTITRLKVYIFTRNMYFRRSFKLLVWTTALKGRLGKRFEHFLFRK